MTNLEKYYDSIVAISNEFSFHDAVFMLRKYMTINEFYEYRKNEKEYNNKTFLQEKQENLEWLNTILYYFL